MYCCVHILLNHLHIILLKFFISSHDHTLNGEKLLGLNTENILFITIQIIVTLVLSTLTLKENFV